MKRSWCQGNRRAARPSLLFGQHDQSKRIHVKVWCPGVRHLSMSVFEGPQPVSSYERKWTQGLDVASLRDATVLTAGFDPGTIGIRVTLGSNCIGRTRKKRSEMHTQDVQVRRLLHRQYQLRHAQMRSRTVKPNELLR